MAGKSKVVKKAEKASVRAAATSGRMGSQKLKELDKSSKLNKAAGGKAKSALAIPGSRQDRLPNAPKTSKSLAKRVNQSKVARGEKPRPLYVSKATATKDKNQYDRMQASKKDFYEKEYKKTGKNSWADPKADGKEYKKKPQ